MAFTDKALQSNFLATCAQLREGRLTLRTPDGARYEFGDHGPEAEMQIQDWAAASAFAAHGQVGLGEAYARGLWDTPSVDGLLQLVMRNREHLGSYDQSSPRNRAKFRFVDTIRRANSIRSARKNNRTHHDVGNEFYQLWLDDGMTFSSGLFASNGDDLAQAQTRKNSRILSRLGQGERLLEVGCGWGGFTEQASATGRDVTGVTVSRNQHSYADGRLDGRADIQLGDYRDVVGKFDNIVSIEMMEALGERHWPSYFTKLKSSLAAGGRVLLQAITVRDDCFQTCQTSSDYIRRYVFSGGMPLSNQVITQQANSAGLQVSDRFAFGQDYATTCRIWAERLVAQKRRIMDLGYGEEFFRKWQYYLEIYAASFAIGQTDVVQVELVHA